VIVFFGGFALFGTAAAIVQDEVLADKLIFWYMLVLTPEGFVTSGPSAVAIDYGAVTNSKCHIVRNNRRLIWKDTAKLTIEQPNNEEKVSVSQNISCIDGSFPFPGLCNPVLTPA
jgi:hypothetical protein